MNFSLAFFFTLILSLSVNFSLSFSISLSLSSLLSLTFLSALSSSLLSALFIPQLKYKPLHPPSDPSLQKSSQGEIYFFYVFPPGLKVSYRVLAPAYVV